MVFTALSNQTIRTPCIDNFKSSKANGTWKSPGEVKGAFVCVCCDKVYVKNTHFLLIFSP